MENSGADSMSKPLSNEESSWTFYFEDFLCKNSNNTNEFDDQNCFSSGYETPVCLVSDAASLVGSSSSKGGGNLKNLSFKKTRKIKGLLVIDDALEDTASSPVNSPKVCHLNQMDMHLKEKDHLDMQEKINTSGKVDGTIRELGVFGRDSECTELKKKGLCLVPVSLLAKYLD